MYFQYNLRMAKKCLTVGEAFICATSVFVFLCWEHLTDNNNQCLPVLLFQVETHAFIRLINVMQLM